MLQAIADEKIVFILVALLILISGIMFAIYYFFYKKRQAFAIPNLPAGSLVLLEGPIESKKSIVCNEHLKKSLEAGRRVWVIGVAPNEQRAWFKQNTAEGRLVIKEASESLTQNGVTIQNALNDGAGAICLTMLNVLLVNESLENAVSFILFTAQKTRAKGVELIFLLDPDATTKPNASSIENLMDCIIEFKTDGDLDLVRIKKMPGGQFESDWHPL